MIELDRYLIDGADWQSRSILAFLQSRYEWMLNDSYLGNGDYAAQLRVDRFNNVGGREHGYVISVIYNWKYQKTIAFYEHRNCDDVYVIHRDGYIGIDTPYAEWVGADYQSKYDCDKSFKCGQIMECGMYIVNEVKNFISECIEKSKTEKAEEDER